MIANGLEYAIARQLVFYQDALKLANQCLVNDGKFGVIPSTTVPFRESKSFNKKVNDVIKNFKKGRY